MSLLKPAQHHGFPNYTPRKHGIWITNQGEKVEGQKQAQRSSKSGITSNAQFSRDMQTRRLITSPCSMIKQQKDKKKNRTSVFIWMVFVAIFFQFFKTLHHKIKTIAAKLIKMVQAHSALHPGNDIYEIFIFLRMPF